MEIEMWMIIFALAVFVLDHWWWRTKIRKILDEQNKEDD